MKGTLWTIIVVCCIALAGAGACTKDSSEATTDESSSSQSEPVAIAKADPSPDRTPPMGGDTGAAEAWAMVRQQMITIQSTATTQQKMMEAVGKAEALLTEFIDTYSDSQEAMDARFELGTLYVATRRTDKAIVLLEQYLEHGDENREKTAFAHYYVAEAYKTDGHFKEAGEHYGIIVARYADVNPQVTSIAREMLKDIPTLSQLGVGGTPIPIEQKDLDGKVVTLDAYKGKVVLLDFWATWCRPCIAEMPNVIKLYNKYSEQGFEIIGVSLDQSRPALESYVRNNKMTWPQLFDGKGWGNEIAGDYRVRSIPMTYLIDRQGKIRYRSIRGPQLEAAVAELLKETS